jgi:hypothetical protein
MEHHRYLFDPAAMAHATREGAIEQRRVTDGGTEHPCRGRIFKVPAQTPAAGARSESRIGATAYGFPVDDTVDEDEDFVVDPWSTPADRHIDEGTCSRAIREGT